MAHTQLATNWDVIVIGGGPAGMMAAAGAAQRGRRTLLIEKNAQLGKKLLITGGGRCNVTNHKLEVKHLIESYTHKPKALYSLFTRYSVADTLEFFHSRHMPTKVEPEDRVFPISDSAQSVWDVVVDYLFDSGAQVLSNSPVINLSWESATKQFSVSTADRVYTCESCIVATGGTSHPETGSTGDAYAWLGNMGHRIIENDFALVPVALSDAWVSNLAGVTLTDVKIILKLDGKKQLVKTGKLLFTHFGVSGPTVLNMSSQIGDLLGAGDVVLEVDLFPDLDHPALLKQITDIILQQINKKIQNSLNAIVPSSLLSILLEMSDINPDTANHSVTREQKSRLVHNLKALRLTVAGLLGADKAIVSSGGVDITEIDFQTMRSRLIPNLFVIGDMLNIDRPSGGYSLQICWSSGYLAGENA